jgi:protein TonB
MRFCDAHACFAARHRRYCRTELPDGDIMPGSSGPARSLTARGLSFLTIVTLAALTGCGAKGGTGARTAAPPVAVRAMPPIPDLSEIRTFTEAIPGLPADRTGITAAAPQRLGDLRYPEAAWNQGLQGWAVYDFVVAPDGSVNQAYVRLVAASDDVFAKPAEDAVRGARFTPAAQNGKPVASLVRLPVYFSLDEASRQR